MRQRGRFPRGDETDGVPGAGQELIRQALDAEGPWLLWSCSAAFDLGVLHVWMEDIPNTDFPCPVCEAILPCAGYAEQRIFRSRQRKRRTYIYIKPPQLYCPVHGSQLVTLPWERVPDRWEAMPATFKPEDDATGAPAGGGA